MREINYVYSGFYYANWSGCWLSASWQKVVYRSKGYDDNNISFTLFLGVSVGNNPDIMDNLDTIGLDGLIITIASLAGSLLAGWFVYHKFFKNFK